jgi:hypothetical protein
MDGGTDRQDIAVTRSPAPAEAADRTQILATVADIAGRIADLERRLAQTDDQVVRVFDRMDDASLERFVWED